MWSDDETVMISAIEHYSYCPRQCALIHVEAIYDENVFTLRGTRAHERADTTTWEMNGTTRIERALPLWSERLGLNGRGRHHRILRRWNALPRRIQARPAPPASARRFAIMRSGRLSGGNVRAGGSDGRDLSPYHAAAARSPFHARSQSGNGGDYLPDSRHAPDGKDAAARQRSALPQLFARGRLRSRRRAGGARSLPPAATVRHRNPARIPPR